MDALMLTMLVALHLGAPAEVAEGAASIVAGQRMLVTGAATLVTFERREVRRMAALPDALRRRGRTMVFAVADTGDLQMALLDRRGRVLCSGAGFVELASRTVFLQGCGD